MKKRDSWKQCVLTFFASQILLGCMSHSGLAASSFTDQVSQKGEAVLVGWVRLQGEVMLYADEETLEADKKSTVNDNRRRKCISGVFQNHYDPENLKKLAQYNSKKVVIKGIIVSYNELPYEDAPLLARRVLAGSVIPNFCFGDTVILIESITYY